MDFKGEAITFKATTTGVISILSHCIETMVTREESFRRRLEKEIERRRKVEELYKQVLEEAKTAQKQAMVKGGPDYEVGLLQLTVVQNDT